VSHSASRNGGTLFLLHLLQWLKQHTDYQLEILVNGRGEMLEDLRAVGPTKVWRNPAFLLGSLPPRWQARLRPRLEAQMLRGLLRGQHYDLVHANTVATWKHVPFLAQRSRSLLWHVHELEYAVRLTTGNEGWRQTFPLAKRFVAGSGAVKETLVKEFQVPAEKVDVVHEFIPAIHFTPEEYKLKRQRIRNALGWPEDVFVVGGCGSPGWRKGTDLFLQAARAVGRKGYEKMGFFWIGGRATDEETMQFVHDVRQLGLQDRCRWVAGSAQYMDYYCAMDAFALTSREDPLALVQLEAGAMGLPMVCFENAGGGPEFVSDGAGLVAPYHDAETFATQLIRLHDDPDLRRRLGTEAARRVRSTHTVEHQAPKVLQSIKCCLETT
jgi:glycosyltransferase involved in cell wall biosynthesis